MARNGHNKKIYYVAIAIYLSIVAISLLICFLLNTPDYFFALVPFGITIIFIVVFFISYYDALYKIDPDNVDEIKNISADIEVDDFFEKLRANGFEQFGKQIIYKTYNDRNRKYKRYLYLSTTNNFDFALEECLKELQKVEAFNRTEYFEIYIILLSKNIEYITELYKESRANYYNFTDITFSIKEKLFKCLIFNGKEKILYYYKINIYPKSLDAIDFIEKEICEVIKI